MTSYHHSPESAHLDGDELSTDPANGGDTRCEERDVNDQRDEYEDGELADGGGLDDELVVNGVIVEGCRCDH